MISAVNKECSRHPACWRWQGWPVSSQLANPASTGGHLRTAPAGRAPLLCPTTRGSLMGDRNMPARQASATCFSGMTVVWPGEKVTGSPIDR